METNHQNIPAVQMQELSCGYGDTLILDRISGEIPSAKISFVLGGSGCGKSTLFKTLVGLQPKLAGDCSVLGYDLQDFDGPDREAGLKELGIMFQQGALLSSKNILENTMMPVQQHTNLSDFSAKELAAFKLKQLGLGHALKRFPSELSGGMLKRAAIARAMVLEPRVLFCDEPSAGLDPITSDDLDGLFVELKESSGATIVIISHEVRSIKAIADHLLVLDSGKMIFNGSYDQVTNEDHPFINDFFGKSTGNHEAKEVNSFLNRISSGGEW